MNFYPILRDNIATNFLRINLFIPKIPKVHLVVLLIQNHTNLKTLKYLQPKDLIVLGLNVLKN